MFRESTEELGRRSQSDSFPLKQFPGRDNFELPETVTGGHTLIEFVSSLAEFIRTFGLSNAQKQGVLYLPPLLL